MAGAGVALSAGAVGVAGAGAGSEFVVDAVGDGSVPGSSTISVTAKAAIAIKTIPAIRAPQRGTLKRVVGVVGRSG
ncbi:hypothetical protein AJ87_03060 [Rhizobium yanglingense]|nr:hypothetical protein AJ87_03060 [Rhizobium yanglingense]